MFYDKKWTLKHKGDVKKDGLCDKLHISPEISQILKNRGINDDKDANIFMNPSLEHLYDPFLMKDMEKSVDRIKKAMENKERIWIYGDYDVDGVSSTSILYLYFKSINYNVDYYIPNRLEEGYGLNKEAIEKIIKSGCDLIITVDCGITSVEEVEFAKNSGVDVIVTDHHECQENIPNAYAIINPKQEDCNYPFESLCGCGVAFKLIQGLTPKDEFEISMYNYLEIVTFATICDIVPLVGENRIIVKNGLNLMKNGNNLGIKSLIKICGIDSDKISSSHIGFSLGPRINASGRLGYSYLGVQLFISQYEEEAMELAMLLEEKNNERQMIESKMYKEAEEIIANDPRYIDEKVLVVAKEHWQHGVIGIVASKLTEKYYKPTILLTIEEGEGRGSARSIKGFSIFEALLDCSDLLNRFGGHEQAAGLSLDEEKIQILRQKINEKAEYKLNDEDMVENINIELELNEDVVSFELIDELHKLEPFGMNNPSPRFIMRDLEMIDIRCIGKERQHLKFTVKKKYEYDCIGFNMAYLASKFMRGDKVDLLFQVDENNYMGNKKIQFLLKDVRMSYPKDINKNQNLSKLMKYIKPIEFNYSIYNYIDINGTRDINIFDYINENTLIICNSIKGLCKSLSDISLTGHEYNLNFNIIDDYNDNVDVIFFPYIDKIDIKRYNNIILYDYLYSLEEYSYIYDKIKDSNNIIKYYEKSDISCTDNIVYNMIPDRNDFVIIYKRLMNDKSVDIEYANIIEKFNMDKMKFLNILRVFKDLNLIVYENRNDVIHIEAMPKPNLKLDLNSSHSLQILNNFKQKYDTIKK